MKITLGNRTIEIISPFLIKPNLGKLEKELKKFFGQNKIEGTTLKEFRVDKGIIPSHYEVVPLNPHLEESLSGGDYQKKLEDIGKKYGIRRLGFVYWCYLK